LFAESLEFYLGSHCLCLYVPVYSPALSCTNFKVSGLKESPLSTLSWYLYRVTDIDLVSAFCMQTTSFSQQHLLKRLSFLHCMFWAHLSKIR
jgi:hypothetical protein